MFKRIGVIGKNKSLQESASKKLKGGEIEVVPLRPGDELPANLSAVVVAAEDIRAVAEVARELGDRQEELLGLIAEAIDSREGLGEGSSRRVMEHAARFGRALGLTPADQATLERGALLRDIGKLRIPNAVLLKYTALTHDEWSILQGHTHIGGDLVKETGALHDIEPIVCRHHECFDGTGYPDGLEGGAIPRLAHVVRILDVFCAMTSPRAYRQGKFTATEAIEHIRGESGKHFAPDLVEVFLDAKIGEQE